MIMKSIEFKITTFIRKRSGSQFMRAKVKAARLPTANYIALFSAAPEPHPVSNGELMSG